MEDGLDYNSEVLLRVGVLPRGRGDREPSSTLGTQERLAYTE